MSFTGGKGRSSGKINIIDLVIVLLVISVAGGAYMLFFRDSDKQVTNTDKLVYDFEITNVNQDFVDAITPGDPIRDSNRGNELGTVVSKASRKATMLNEDLINGRYIIAEVPEAYDVVITIEAAADITPANIIVGGAEVKVGKKFFIKGKGYANQGFVTKMTLSGQ
ncbi:MAG: DUF4330 domain-containing protein [Clostridiaceae bacterium]|jgi:hypothetical protein|nr:DUF4330 domain-containing protein [Clostridiaceae bacterium]